MTVAETIRKLKTAAMPTRPAQVQILDRTAYVLDAETRETLFTVNQQKKPAATEGGSIRSGPQMSWKIA
jgi:hypothetical protein